MDLVANGWAGIQEEIFPLVLFEIASNPATQDLNSIQIQQLVRLKLVCKNWLVQIDAYFMDFVFKDRAKGLKGVHYAVDRGNVRQLNYMISKKYPINEINRLKQTPLHVAALKGDVSCLAKLLAQKPEVDSRDVNNDTPLHLAVKGGSDNAVTQLIAAKANINAQNTQGAIPLHLAVQKAVKSSCRILLEAGSDAFEPDSDGINCYQMALDSKKNKITQLFVEKCPLIRKGSSISLPFPLLEKELPAPTVKIKTASQIIELERKSRSPKNKKSEPIGSMTVFTSLFENVLSILGKIEPNISKGFKINELFYQFQPLKSKFSTEVNGMIASYAAKQSYLDVIQILTATIDFLDAMKHSQLAKLKSLLNKFLNENKNTIQKEWYISTIDLLIKNTLLPEIEKRLKHAASQN